EARAPLLPQLAGAAAYERATANAAARPGTLPISSGTSSSTSYDYYNASVTLSQLVWDFGQTTNRWRAARAGAHAQEASAEAQRQQSVLQIRTSYFAAQAAQEMVEVARRALANSDRHLAQIRAFVDVGTRPEIDVAQALTTRANAEVRLIGAENDDVSAKAALDAATGVLPGARYAVTDDLFGAVEGEADATERLLAQAFSRRPDVRATEAQLAAQNLGLEAARATYWPALVVAGTASEAGTTPDTLTWNWSAQIGLNWSLFQGALTPAQVREQRALVSGAVASSAGVRQAAALEIVQAANAVRAQRAAITAATHAVESAERQLALAEARYETGMGSALELDDAQLAETNASVQLVTARFALSTARAQLAKALGLAVAP
ncbi:MAG TPA: TolC family protein, partial [Polyangia bacterium]|nr:TolC family protein [Polyangia bacterium]